jgi:hypothetical protein
MSGRSIVANCVSSDKSQLQISSWHCAAAAEAQGTICTGRSTPVHFGSHNSGG